MMQLIVLMDNIRSAYNVGAILRTCDAAGVKRVICCGTTPYPRLKNDPRDPVVAKRNTKEIAKTSLGAEQNICIEYKNDSTSTIGFYRKMGWVVYGLERAPMAVSIFNAKLTTPALLILGSETDGIQQQMLSMCDSVVEIPQFGQKESLNVAVAAGIAIYQFVETRAL